VICSPKFPLAKYKELSPAQLVDHPYISREPGSGTREFTDAYLHHAGIAPEQVNLVMEMGSPISLIGVVETGLGYAIASSASIATSLRLGDIVAIPLKPRLTRDLSMVYPKEKFRSRLVTAFVDYASKRLKEFAA